MIKYKASVFCVGVFPIHLYKWHHHQSSLNPGLLYCSDHEERWLNKILIDYQKHKISQRKTVFMNSQHTTGHISSIKVFFHLKSEEQILASGDTSRSLGENCILNWFWQFCVMSFGFCQGQMPTTFEWPVETFKRVTLEDLAGILWQHSQFQHNFPKHLTHFEEILEKLWLWSELSPKKYQAFSKQLKYLGHIISSQDVRNDHKKMEAVVRVWPVPKDKHKVQSYLELWTYYRDLFKNLLVWIDNKVPRSIHQLKKFLSSALILAYPRAGYKFIVDMDASKVGIGVLSQLKDNEE